MKFFTLDLRFRAEGLMKTEFLFTFKEPINLLTKNKYPRARKPWDFVSYVYFLCPVLMVPGTYCRVSSTSMGGMVEGTLVAGRPSE